MGAHRSSIADRLSVLTSVPVFAVMGNYETLSDSQSWKQTLSDVGINALHNQISLIKSGKRAFVFGDLEMLIQTKLK